MRWLVVIAVLVLAGCGAPPSPATASPVFSSPGPLIADHAQLACTDCHFDGSAMVAAAKCTGCHATLASRIDANTGLHAKPTVRSTSCVECHRDHRGPSYDAQWGFFDGRDRFDHAYTGWKLGKGHRLACERCHTNANAAEPSFTGATFACGSCHSPPHANTPYEAFPCEACHLSSDSFKTVTFDHEEKTRPIGTSHRHIACASCHTPQLGTKEPARACASCHASRDPHGGRFGAIACEKCHAPSMSFVPGQFPPPWKPNAFDHRSTGWTLTARHSELACSECHRTPGAKVFAALSSGKDCTGCHEHRKVHDLKYANGDCIKCHFASGSNRTRPVP